jgi:anti-anti-sigma factor
MAITSSESDDGRTVTIHVAGRFDFATHQEFMQAYKAYARGEKSYIVDLKNAEYLDSSAMGMLLQLRDYSTDDSNIELANGNDAVIEILRIANFDKLFKLN